MVALGFLAGLWTSSRRAPRAGIPGDKILDLGPWLILGAIVGARTWYVITFWQEQFAGRPFLELFMIWQGGLVYYGGLVGASLAYIVVSRMKQIPLWTGADVLAPGVALGQVFGRLGCLCYGCCYGTESHLPWAIRFPPGHATHPVGGEAIPVHPTQIYESVLCLALYAGLAWLFRRRKYEGQVFASLLTGYAVLRFLVEMFRGDYPQDQLLLGGHMTPAQLVSVLMLAVGLILLAVLRQRPVTQNA